MIVFRQPYNTFLFRAPISQVARFAIYLIAVFDNQSLNPQAPVAQNIADEVVFRRFQDEGAEFFLIGPH